jgi:hypothetical protein
MTDEPDSTAAEELTAMGQTPEALRASKKFLSSFGMAGRRQWGARRPAI